MIGKIPIISGMKGLRITAKILLFLILTSSAAVAGAGAVYFAVTKEVRFDPKLLESKSVACIVTDENGNALTRNDDYTCSREIPSFVKNAFIAIEDKRFYRHNGIDARALFRATKNNLLSFSLKEGGSTISQQLVKNVYLSGEKTFTRKMKELKLTRELERKFTKDEILSAYLNRVYFGEGCYGIGRAAKTYFAKKPSDLTPEEGAMLAALVKAPSVLDPFKNPAGARRRRNLVLSEMKAQKFISDTEYKKSINKDIILNYKENYERRKYYVSLALGEAANILGLENENGLSGYTVKTYYRDEAETALPLAADYNLSCNFATIVLSNDGGKVIACASDTGTLCRVPASCAKPWLVYAPAIEERIITEASVIDDSKTDFGKYSPSNYGEKYRGYISAKDALAFSSNVAAVSVYRNLGVKKAKTYAEKLGVSIQNDDLSAALGNLSGGIDLKTLAGAYLPLSDDGFYTKPKFVSEIRRKDGTLVYRAESEKKKVFSPATAFIVRDMLQACVKYGTARKLSALSFPVCAKTGTNGSAGGNTDAYCVAFTKDFTVAVWLGNADFSPMANSVSGGSYPAAIAGEVLSALHKNDPPTEFSRPDGVIKTNVVRDTEGDIPKLYSTSTKDGDPFYFLAGTEPQQENKPVAPRVKDYKITYKNNNFEIFVVCDEDCNVLIEENEGEREFTLRSGETVTITDLEYDTVYRYTLTPYRLENGVKTEGEQIKIPPVKTDGKKKNFSGFDWWND